MFHTLIEAISLIAHLDSQVGAIVWLSFKVTFVTIVISSLVGLPLGALIAIAPFRGRSAVIVFLNGMMGMPSVIVAMLRSLRALPSAWMSNARIESPLVSST